MYSGKRVYKEKGKRVKIREFTKFEEALEKVMFILLFLLFAVVVFSTFCVKDKSENNNESFVIQSAEKPVVKSEKVFDSRVDLEEDTVVIEKSQVFDCSKVCNEQEKSEDITYIEFKVTAYCSCEKCCGVWANNRPEGKVYGAAGKELIAGYSVAVDRDLYEFGTKFVDKYGNEYEAADVGGAVKGNHLDLYMSDHQEALNWGVKTLELAVVENEDN